MALVDIAEILSFTGMRGGEMEAVTVPPLVSPKGHPNSVRKTAVRNGKTRECDCYPWATGGATVETAGIVKRAVVRGVFGPEWAKMVEQERLTQACSLDENGNPLPYHCDDPRNGTRWVVTDAGERLAFKFKTNDAGETFLYATMVIARSMGYAYYDADGNEIPREMVVPFIKERNDEGKRQGVDDPLMYRDYRAEGIARITIGKTLAWGDARLIADALRNGGTHPTAKDADGNPLTIRTIAESLCPNIGQGVEG